MTRMERKYREKELRAKGTDIKKISMKNRKTLKNVRTCIYHRPVVLYNSNTRLLTIMIKTTKASFTVMVIHIVTLEGDNVKREIGKEMSRKKQRHGVERR